MRDQVTENMEKFSEFGMEMVKRLQTVQTRLLDAWTGRQLEAAALWVDAGVKQLRLMGEAQHPYDFYAGQAQLAQEYMEKVSEYCRQGLSAVTDLQRELTAVAAPRPQAIEAAAREIPKPAAAPRPVAEPAPAPRPQVTKVEPKAV